MHKFMQNYFFAYAETKDHEYINLHTSSPFTALQHI